MELNYNFGRELRATKLEKFSHEITKARNQTGK